MDLIKFLKKLKPRRRRSRYRVLMATCKKKVQGMNCQCFFDIAKEHFMNADYTMPPERIAKNIIKEVGEQALERKLTLDCAARQIIKTSEGFETTPANDFHFSIDREIFCKQLLIDIVTLFAVYKVDDRQLLRDLLKTLFPYSRSIDRRLLFFGEAYAVFPFILDYEGIKDKVLYILKNTAGWRVSSEEHPWNTATVKVNPSYFLELPLQRTVRSEGFTTLLAEALYQIPDKDLLLCLLRHGVRPNAFFLWPVTLIADLKILLNPRSVIERDLLAPERKSIQYFCRARAGFRRILVNRETDANYHLPDLEGAVNQSLLIMPPATAFLVPDNWCINPCPLQHYCRLVIRSRLCKNDFLPCGIENLPIPNLLKEYIDLQR